MLESSLDLNIGLSVPEITSNCLLFLAKLSNQ